MKKNLNDNFLTFLFLKTINSIFEAKIKSTQSIIYYFERKKFCFM